MVAISKDPLLLNWEKVTGTAVIPMQSKTGFPLPYRVFDPASGRKIQFTTLFPEPLCQVLAVDQPGLIFCFDHSILPAGNICMNSLRGTGLQSLVMMEPFHISGLSKTDISSLSSAT